MQLHAFNKLEIDSRTRNQNALSDVLAVYAIGQKSPFIELRESTFGYASYIQGYFAEYVGDTSGNSRLFEAYEIKNPKTDKHWRSFSIEMFCTYATLCFGFTNNKLVNSVLSKPS